MPQTALHGAAQDGNLNELRQALAGGAEVNAEDWVSAPDHSHASYRPSG